MKPKKRVQFLEYDLTLLAQKVLSRYEFDDGTKPSLQFDDNEGKWVFIENFPLPESFEPNDRINVLIVTVDYPDRPPGGIHLPATSSYRTQVSRIRQALGGHIMSHDDLPPSYRQYVEELDDSKWTWVCYHYKNWSWDYNFNNITEGDCLYKYVQRIISEIWDRG